MNQIRVPYILPKKVKPFDKEEDSGKDVRICYKLTNKTGALPPGAYKEVSMEWFVGLEDKYKDEMIRVHGLSVILEE